MFWFDSTQPIYRQFIENHFAVKMFFHKIVIFLSVFISSLYVSNGLICKGCLELDELTFDKLIAKFSTVLVKFDIAFPYGKKHDEYAKFAKEISESNVDDMIVCVVGIKNYGEPTNDKLSERFYLDEQLPAIKLFTRSNTLKWTDYPKGASKVIQNWI